MIKPPPGAGVGTTAGGPRKIIIVANWSEELKQRAPMD